MTTLAALDFESAGEAPGRTDAPVQCGIAHMTGCLIDPASLYASYINPQRPVTWSARQVHGISDEDVAAAPVLSTLWPEFRTRLSGNIIVAHASGTERRFLRAFPFHNFGPWLDTLLLSRRIWPGLTDYSLGALIAIHHLGAELDALCPGRKFHDALYDATASLLLVRTFLQQTNLPAIPQEMLKA